MEGTVSTLVFLVLCSSLVSASDPGPLQDFCVAVDNLNDGVFVNGKFCKNPNQVTADDFYFSGLRKEGNTSNAVGSIVTPLFVEQLPGLNTLGVSMGRIDFAPGGTNPPHAHPRASEIFMAVRGKLLVGFVASNQNNHRLFTKILYPGDVFAFPVGLVHFQLNIGKTKALAYAKFNSQEPGIITIASTIFGSNPPIDLDVLTKAFQLDEKIVIDLQKNFTVNSLLSTHALE